MITLVCDEWKRTCPSIRGSWHKGDDALFFEASGKENIPKRTKGEKAVIAQESQVLVQIQLRIIMTVPLWLRSYQIIK